MRWIDAIVRVLLANVVPVWGFAHENWSPGTTLALYWLQTVVAIATMSVLIVTHRRLTRKAGHVDGSIIMRDTKGKTTVRRGTYLQTFLLMAIPFTLAHGIFLGFLLGLVWKDAQGGVNPDDLREGVTAMLGVIGLGFAIDMFGVGRQSFAWLRFRATTVLQRTVLVHLVIVFGLAVAAFSDQDAAAFFVVFLAFKVAFDMLSELPTYDPKEPPAWIARLMNRLGDGKGDFAGDRKRMREEARKSEVLAEETLESLPG
jgi:hypothetical protein